MGFKELVKKVQTRSGFSDSESQEALELMVETLAERLEEGERKDFASQLPTELQDIALAVMPTNDDRKHDLIQEFMEKEAIEESRAKKQIFAAWETLKEEISDGEIRHIKTQLPRNTAELLY